MMPVLEQSQVHHHHLHGHNHQAFYRQQHTPEPTGKMQLTLILPNGIPSVLNVDANTPMMDLLVQAASLNKLNPSGYSLVVLDSNRHVIHFKANQTVGQIVNNCHLPQINEESSAYSSSSSSSGSSTISLLPKETTHPTPSSKTKTQPFEITVRLQVNLPDAQKILLRVDPTLPMHEIKEQICKQKKYAHSNEYTLRLPNKIDHPLLLGLSLAEYKTNELTLVHLKQLDGGAKFPGNQLQSFDRLYRVRSESQPPKERPLEIPNEQQAAVNNNRLTNGANANRSLTLRPSHTTLHAYWNDPNFDTQSQLSNSSSTTKKRRAPRAPMCISPNRYDPQIVYVRQQQPFLNTHSPSPPPRHDHHQSCESLLSENARRKRKAPVVAATNSAERREEDARERVEQNQPINVANDVIRPGVHPPPPPTERKTGPSSVERPNGDYRSIIEINPKPIDETQRIDITIDPVDGQRLLNLLQTQTATSAKLVITTHVPEAAHIESSLPPPSPTEKNEELAPAETTTSATAIPSHTESEQKPVLVNDAVPTPAVTVDPTQVKSPVPKPPRQSMTKEKKSTSITGLLRIINDHTERAQVYQEKEKQEREAKENISYFRVAKSRFGKFETENQGFVHSSAAFFDSSAKQDQQQRKISFPSEAPASSTQQKLITNVTQGQTNAKDNHNVLKNSINQEGQKSVNSMNELTAVNSSALPQGPIQLEVTERTTHITVTVESDRKQMITRVSPVSQQASPSPPTVAPKPFGKTITEHRTVRRIGHDGEPLSAVSTTNKRAPSTDREARVSASSTTSHESLMDSIRKFGGSQNLGKK